LQRAGLQLNEKRFLEEFHSRLQEYYMGRVVSQTEQTTRSVLEGLLNDLGVKDFPPQKMRQAMKVLYAVTQRHWQAEKELISTLEVLKQQGYALGLISNAGDDDDVKTLIDKAGIRHYLDFAVSSAGEGIRKPDPRIFHLVLNTLGVSPAQTVMVGDRLETDILGAHNAGMAGILITRRADQTENSLHLQTIIPDAAIESLAELPDLLQNLHPSP
jgi:HAD superfamily hydrolase (TIGR01662 family)